MCEPQHSIVQYPDNDDHGPTKSRLDAAVKGLLDQGKRILRWFHFSKMGSGHSGATGFGRTQMRHLPNPTSYEAMWWNRTVKRDGEFRGESFDIADALECAEEYANRTSIGDLTQLRRFLETSMQQTNQHQGYVRQFVDGMLNKEGRDSFRKRAKKALGLDLANYYGMSNTGFFRSLTNDARKRNSLTKFMLGYTRKRGLLVPEWADDASIWTPPGQKGLEAAPVQ